MTKSVSSNSKKNIQTLSTFDRLNRAYSLLDELTCTRCVAVTESGERCKNRTCRETNKPLCAVHSKKLGDIMRDFHGLSSKRRGDVLKPLSEYLRRRNIQFDLRLVDVPDFEPDVMEKLEKWKDTVLAKYNSLGVQQKSKRLEAFASYLDLRGAKYVIELRDR